MITKEEIKTDLIKVRDEINKIPTKKEYKKYGIYGTTTINRRFDSWNNALLETFNEINLRSTAPKHNIKCDYCETEFERSDDKLKEKNYCSVSCGNKAIPRRKLSKKCETCDTLIRKSNRFCKNCSDEYKKKHSIEIRTLKSFKHIYGPVRYSRIREHAREQVKHLPDVCNNCGYDKHVEVCHKKAIPDFNDDTLIGEINSTTNLVKLCKNCHWESHNGYLDINLFKSV